MLCKSRQDVGLAGPQTGLNLGKKEETGVYIQFRDAVTKSLGDSLCDQEEFQQEIQPSPGGHHPLRM